MESVVVERRFDEPVAPEIVAGVRKRLSGCAQTHRVALRHSLVSRDRRRMICLFEAPDAESVRTANRNAGNPCEAVYTCTIHGPHPEATSGEGELVIVERRWDEPVEFDDIQAIEDEFQWCLEQYRIKFLHSYFSRDRRRMLCLYTAPDAEAVRTANRTAGMPAEAIYAADVVSAG